MKPSRRSLSVAALVALAAWANVQAMACCWLPDVVAAARSSMIGGGAAETSMAADHSCCPGSDAAEAANPGSPETAKSASASASGSPGGCGMSAQGFASVCCESGEVAAVSASGKSPHSTMTADVFPAAAPVLARLPAAPEAGVSGRIPDTGGWAGSGSPVYLSVRHFLI